MQIIENCYQSVIIAQLIELLRRFASLLGRNSVTFPQEDDLTSMAKIWASNSCWVV